MLDRINYYFYGYVATPIIEACLQQGLFELLDRENFCKRSWLISQLDANDGYFSIALQSLDSLGLIEKDTKDGYRLKNQFEQEVFSQDLTQLYATSSEKLLESGSNINKFLERFELLNSLTVDADSNQLCFAKGAVLLPLVAQLMDLKPEKIRQKLCTLSSGIAENLEELLTRLGCLEAGDNSHTGNENHQFDLATIKNLLAYREILSKLKELIFSQNQKLTIPFSEKLSSELPSLLNNETANQILIDEISLHFSRRPLTKQAKAIVFVGSFDGQLITTLSQKIFNDTLRGKNIQKYPLKTFFFDSDQTALDKQISLLKNIQVVSNVCDISDPEKILESLRDSGFESKSNIIYVNLSSNIKLSSDKLAKKNSRLKDNDAELSNFAITPDGKLITNDLVTEHWYRYLKKWKGLLDNATLFTLQPHTLTPISINQNLSFLNGYFQETINRLCARNFIDSESYIKQAAAVGLFNQKPVNRFPVKENFCQLSLHQFDVRDYIIRNAREEDLNSLYRLEDLCWAKEIKSSENLIAARLKIYPEGQFVLEKEGKVLGVIYSQRIDQISELDNCDSSNVHHLHNPEGSKIQLLAVNIDPEYQDFGYGDQLLEFMLQRSSLVNGVEKITAVTRCKDYTPDHKLSPQEYIRLQDSSKDSILAFHHSHGAKIVKLLPNYRPEDDVNLGNGVLVIYDVHTRTPISQKVIESHKIDLEVMTEERVRQSVIRKVKLVMGSKAKHFQIAHPLMEMGLNSADLLRLQTQLIEEFDMQLQPGFFFEYNTTENVIEYLIEQLVVEEVNLSEGKIKTSSKLVNKSNGKERSAKSTDIAVVGMSCKLPGGIESPEGLWKLVASGRNNISNYPSNRGFWPDSLDKPAIDRGGFIFEGDAFDASFFRISPIEAQITDPQQRILLELSWSCLEDAGILPETLKLTDTGVFVGASNCDYGRLIQSAGLEVQAHNAVGGSLAVLANRLSYFFDFCGPSLVIDTACSSSLVAVHTAIQSIHAGECEIALVGGVNFICHPDLSIAYHKAGMLSPDGLCKVFDASANGYVRAEGGVVFLLKPLSNAVKDNNRIHAVLKGSAINHGGLAGGLTVPNPRKQSELIAKAWKKADVSPFDISYIEAHGTGTSLGDPIEIQGIQKAFSGLENNGRDHSIKHCGIGSLKSNLGHLESAAGISGLLKIIVSMQKQKLPASINCQKINPKINLDNSPLYIVEESLDWKSDILRLAGVSSFGSGGANAHVIVEEYPIEVYSELSSEEYLFLLSADNDKSLRTYASNVVKWLEENEVNLADAIYTWQTGRTAMNNRLAIKVNNIEQLKSKLSQYLADDKQLCESWQGRDDNPESEIGRLVKGKSGSHLISQALLDQDYNQLAILWTNGAKIDWGQLYSQQTPVTISLPTYPFIRQKYWLKKTTSSDLVPTEEKAANWLHPLLHFNTSDLNRQSYSSTFSGNEFFLSDHQVQISHLGNSNIETQKVLPAVTYLEMARAAILSAVPEPMASGILSLHNIVWLQPVIVSSEKKVSIALLAEKENSVQFEVYSENSDDIGTSSRLIHCQGKATFSQSEKPETINIEKLKLQPQFFQSQLYSTFSKMGFSYGPSHQGLKTTYKGKTQLLGHLALPDVVANTNQEYYLHPSIMDGSLQAAISLVVDENTPSSQPLLPFALEELRIFSECSEEMFVSITYANDVDCQSSVIKLDLDICNPNGEVCIQMKGYSSRFLNLESAQKESQDVSSKSISSVYANPVWNHYPIVSEQNASNFKTRKLITCNISAQLQQVLIELNAKCEVLPIISQQSDLALRYEDYATACFELFQKILHEKPKNSTLVQVLVDSSHEHIFLAGLSGLFKTVALENPKLSVQTIFVEAGLTGKEISEYLNQCVNFPQQAIIQYTRQQSKVLSWEVNDIEPDLKATIEIPFKHNGVYIITGGLGGLGTLFAQEIINQTANAKIILTGRSSLTSDKQRQLDRLNKSQLAEGIVEYQSLDLRQLDQVQNLITDIRNRYKKIDGIIHSAGMIADGLMFNKTTSEFKQVLSPKVLGTSNLDKASKDCDLDFIILFSSIVSTLGNLGQSDYAAANGFMDQFAAYRNKLCVQGLRKGHTVSINWPLWKEGGMGLDKTSQETLKQTTGALPIETEIAFSALYESLSRLDQQTFIMHGLSDKIRNHFITTEKSSVVHEEEVLTGDTSGETDKDVQIDSRAILAKIQAILVQEAADTIELEPEKIQIDADFQQYGFDSILLVDFVENLEEKYKLELSPTVFFEYSTIKSMSEYFAQSFSSIFSEQLDVEYQEESVVAVVSEEQSVVELKSEFSTTSRFISSHQVEELALSVTSQPSRKAENIDSQIAIIGMDGVFAGSQDVESFWKNIKDHTNLMTEVPLDHWDYRPWFDNDREAVDRTYCKWGSFIEDVDKFDAEFFDISPREAEWIDPQLRILLQSIYKTSENAGVIDRLKGTNTGVFVGVCFHDYFDKIAELNLATDPHAVTGNYQAVIANRISFQFNLTGPSVAVDTACASSLFALHQACKAIHNNECEMAFVGGVNLLLSSLHYRHFSSLGALSGTGRCHTFDAKADGYVPAEAIASLLVKPLDAALEDGDRIHALVKGSAALHGGATPSLTAPSVGGEKNVILAAWKNSKIDPSSLTYIEAHGTGTKLGDPIEISALVKAFEIHTNEKNFCAIGSAKSNIGHAEGAAGIVGIVKVIQQMKNREIPAMPFFEKLNSYINLDDTPLYINKENISWQTKNDLPRRAGVSSFGFSGSYAHVVLEEFISTDNLANSKQQQHSDSRVIIPLSARTQEQLKLKVSQLAQFIASRESVLDLNNVAYTLQTGRESMVCRLGFIVSNLSELKIKLDRYCNGDKNQSDYVYAELKDHQTSLVDFSDDEDMQQLIEQWISVKKLNRLLELWSKGFELDWERLRTSDKPRRISLPTYPFAKERHWIDESSSKTVEKNSNLTEIIHPLLHKNTSDFERQSFSSRFTGEEFFLRDHLVNQQKILPAVAYLEIVKEAINHSVVFDEPGYLKINNSVWMQPLLVEREKAIEISLFIDVQGKVEYQINSLSESGRLDEALLHCQGSASFISVQLPQRIDIEQLKESMNKGVLNQSVLYAGFEHMGLNYGTTHQTLEKVYLGQQSLVAKIHLAETIVSDDFCLHPALMDGALQATVALVEDFTNPPSQPSIPFGLDSLVIYSDCTPDMYAWVRFEEESKSGNNLVKYDIDLIDNKGNVCVEMKGFSTRPWESKKTLEKDAEHSRQMAIATPVWKPINELEISDFNLENIHHHILVFGLPKVKLASIESKFSNAICESISFNESDNIADRYSLCSQYCFQKIQKLLKKKSSAEILIQIVVPKSSDYSALVGLSGLLKTAQIENPRVNGQIIVVEQTLEQQEVEKQIQQSAIADCGSVIKSEGSKRFINQWKMNAFNPIQESEKGHFGSPFKQNGVYLITGGLGGLGSLFAQEILQKSDQAKVILTGRKQFSETSWETHKQALVTRLSIPSQGIEYRQLELDNLSQTCQVIADIESQHQTIDGVLHCAGMTLDNFILNKELSEFTQVLTPKVVGTYNLDKALADKNLDFFVLFSSVTSSFGNIGQADYACANGFMDQFSEHRNQLVTDNQRHGKTISINWPLWVEGGMSIDQTSEEILQETTGMNPINKQFGLQAFYYAIKSDYSQIMPLFGDLGKVHSILEMKVAELPAELVVKEKLIEPINSNLNEAPIGSHRNLEQTINYLRKQLSSLLKLPSHKIDPMASMETYGIDSILATKLTNQLEKVFGSLPKTLFFEYQSVQDLSEHFIKVYPEQLNSLLSPITNSSKFETSESVSKAQITNVNNIFTTKSLKSTNLKSPRFVKTTGNGNITKPRESESIAIVGLSGRYPESVDLNQFWTNLRDGNNCIKEVPQARWEWQQYFSEDRQEIGHHYSKWGGFIEGIDEFDPMFFNISPRDAKFIDPQERLFLQHAWMAIEDAGYTRRGLQILEADDIAGQVGVYAGVMFSEYQLLSSELDAKDQRMGFSGNLASIANRVSYVLNLHGPSITMDTMCSSSLTTIHTACQDLKQGRTSLAIAGGVNVSVHPRKYLMLSVGQFISSEGQCQSFGEGGDGYIPGEGVGIVVLKRLSDAKQDRNHIYGVIKGSALSHGGKTNGYTVPNPQAQASAIIRALSESNIDPRHISYLEAHGTGTKLGDPIEIAALHKAFKQLSKSELKMASCAIGSAKSNIGHCESAAGIAGLTKVLLQMKHQQIVPSLHSAKLNPNIDFDNTPFIVNQSLTEWQQPEIDGQVIPRIAGISSFGAGGSNAHIVVEEYAVVEENSVDDIDKAKYLQPGIEVIIPLSARTEAQLAQKAAQLLNFVCDLEEESLTVSKIALANKNKANLLNMAYTLQTGREGMQVRVGFIVDSLSQLKRKLTAYVNGEENIEDVYHGLVSENKQSMLTISQDEDMKAAIGKWIENRKLSKLSDLWSKGLDIDWQKFYQDDSRPTTISLPVYPFAKEKYWLDLPTKIDQSDAAIATTKIHPLLHINSSKLGIQSYQSTFEGNEFFVHSDHISGYKNLNPVVFFEMARAAMIHASDLEEKFSPLEIINTIWTDTSLDSDDYVINIALKEQPNYAVDFEIYHQDNEERVYCQGQIVQLFEESKSDNELFKLKQEMKHSEVNYLSDNKELVSLYQQKNRLLAQLKRVPDSLSDTADYVLHPSLVDFVMQLYVEQCIANSNQLDNSKFVPYSFSSMKILAPCNSEVFVFIRESETNHSSSEKLKLDIDFYNNDGEKCLKIEAIEYFDKQLVKLPETTRGNVKTVQLKAPKRLDFRPDIEPEKLTTKLKHRQAISTTILPKPSSLALVSTKSLVQVNKTSQKKSLLIQLKNIQENNSLRNERTSLVNIDDLSEGIFSLQILSAKKANSTPEKTIRHLNAAIKLLANTDALKVLVIDGMDSCFTESNNQLHNDAIQQKLYHSIVNFPKPTIAVLAQDTSGVGFLMASLCDFIFCGKDSHHVYSEPEQHFYPKFNEYQILKQRYGANIARELFTQSLPINATIKRPSVHNLDSILISSETDVSDDALQLAKELAVKSTQSLKLLKQHLNCNIIGSVNQLKVTAYHKIVPSVEEYDRETSHSVTGISQQICDGKVLLITLASDLAQLNIEELVKALSEVIAQSNLTNCYRSLVIASEYPDFFPITNKSVSNEVVSELQDALTGSLKPVIFALDSDIKDTAFSICQFSDGCVYSKSAFYSCSPDNLVAGFERQTTAIFLHRFGHNTAKEILLTGTQYSGEQLVDRVGHLTVVESTQVIATAIEIASCWAQQSPDELADWKLKSRNEVEQLIHSMPEWSVRNSNLTNSNSVINHSGPIELESSVIKATVDSAGVVTIEMQDREARNMFSEAFIDGMYEVFEHIKKTAGYKVVILTGYDNYFASGGTKETLLAIQNGEVKFTDKKVFELAKQCHLPVISAMQGHGIGAGWSMGMFSDLILFSEESQYVSPYMNYGFTPGAGSTFIFQDNIGIDLSRESLLTARKYTGSLLKQKGLRLPVVARSEVLSTAKVLAQKIAQISLVSLVRLKNQFNQITKEPLEQAYQSELEMHEETFVGHKGTLNQIQNMFAQSGEEESIPRSRQTKQISERAVSIDVDVPREKISPPVVKASMKKLLAGELHMQEIDILEDMQFIDLGLDSITGVTWIRKINDTYKTNIDATKVYAYPTLQKLSQFVADNIPLAENTVFEAKTENSQTENRLAPLQVLNQIKQLLAKELHMQECDIEENMQFIDLGLDSITGVTWIRKINDTYQTRIDATKVYAYPTLHKLSQFVFTEIKDLGQVKEATNKVVSGNSTDIAIVQQKKEAVKSNVNRKPISLATRKAVSDIPQLNSWRNKEPSQKRTELNTAAGNSTQPIAVIGMAGQFPQASNVEEFWQNIVTAKNCIEKIPESRWSLDEYYRSSDKPIAGKTNCQWMGAIAEYDLFDPLFFNISPIEAESMDPQQRIFLQACWSSIENAGYDAKDISGSRCGVFVGCANGDYHQLAHQHQLSAQGFTGEAISILAARISYFLNLKGPCLSIDTACSSSLVAIANACDSLNSDSSDIALAGGVSLMIGPSMHIKTSQAGMLSTDGRCYTFDQRANGFVPGEAVGVVMLKRLVDAQADNDLIVGVIRGWGINQDGKTNGITAPNPESQTALQQAVYDKFSINPECIQLVEAHGTGTALGDPIEVEGLNNSFQKYTDRKQYCALGSVKSNIGHCLTAAGISGFIKLILALKNKQLPPTINFEKLNQHIDNQNNDMSKSPFYINDRLRDWHIGGSEIRQAAISSFGFSGTNAHMVISEPSQNEVTLLSDKVDNLIEQSLVILSAKTELQLQQKVKELAHYVESNSNTLNLSSVAYTLQTGREAMEVRLGFAVSSLSELVRKLKDYLSDNNHVSELYQDQVSNNKESMLLLSQDQDMRETMVDKWISRNNGMKLVELWTKGLNFDWNKLYPGDRPSRCHLPTYPFAKERYWFEKGQRNQLITVLKGDSEALSNGEFLHPLLHVNTSDLNQQKYTSVFNGNEFFLSDHQVMLDGENLQSVLPAVAYLEMARAAAMQACPMPIGCNVIELHNVVWSRPIIVSNSSALSISLQPEICDSGAIDKISYTVFSGDKQAEVLNAQGSIVYNNMQIDGKLNIVQFENHMSQQKMDTDEIYSKFRCMGLYYGDAHQAITSILLGKNQLLAELSLPTKIEDTLGSYMLHPSLMDCALQTTIGLLEENEQKSTQPLLPFSIDKVVSISSCTEKMYAWTRFSNGYNSTDNLIKFDIDLCDREGNICVQILGFSTRKIDQIVDTKNNNTFSTIDSEVNKDIPGPIEFDNDYYQKIIKQVLDNDLTVDEAVKLG